MDRDGAVHGFDEAADDGETEAAAAEAAGGGGVGLDEGIKERGELIGGDAEAGIFDVETESSGGEVGGDAETNFARVGKLDGVSDEVQENLAEALGVAEDVSRDGFVEE